MWCRRCISTGDGICWIPTGKYFSSLYLDEPGHYGNGMFVFEPLFADDLFRKGAESVENLRSEQIAERWMLVPSQVDRKGSLVYRFASPYPFLDGTVDVTGKIRGEGRLELAFSETGADWSRSGAQRRRTK